MNTNLTELEQTLLTKINKNNEEGCFSFDDLDLDMNTFRGVTASLVKKGFLIIFVESYFDGELTTQGKGFLKLNK